MMNGDRESEEKRRKRVLEKLFELVSFTLKNDVDFETVEQSIYLKRNLEEVKARAEELLDKKLVFQEGYFLIRKNYKKIVPEDYLDKKFFALIYKIVIENLQ